MLKIGDFSKLAQVSVKTLRHYGHVGLFKPAWIDRFTGYRYYTLEQLPRLNRILALKDLGFSLDQIRQLLCDDLTAAELRGMMRLRSVELERRIQSEQARLLRVEARLQQIEQEGRMPDYEVVLKSASPQRVIGIRATVGEPWHIDSLFDELIAYVHAKKVYESSAGPFLAIYYDGEHHDAELDVEAAVPISGPVVGTPQMVVHELPGAKTIAAAIHQGSRRHLPRAYNALVAWMESNGYRPSGPNREVYLQGPYSAPPRPSGFDPASFITEVQFPVVRKPVSTYVAQRKEKGEMEPRIVTKPAFTVVGMLYRGKNENNEIKQMWDEFVPRINEIQHTTDWHESYGVCSDYDEEEVFEYVAGVPVVSAENIPDGMVSWDVPEQTYAVFPCTLPTIHEAYEHAFENWLPGSGYQRADGPDFELYDRNFNPERGELQMHIYIPIK
jgi:predicted transcriptional regulator YdeE